jgi:hypothetical protein
VNSQVIYDPRLVQRNVSGLEVFANIYADNVPCAVYFEGLDQATRNRIAIQIHTWLCARTSRENWGWKRQGDIQTYYVPHEFAMLFKLTWCGR